MRFIAGWCFGVDQCGGAVTEIFAALSCALRVCLFFAELWCQAKYVTETGQPAIFLIVEISKKWYYGLPADLQQIIDKAAARELVAVNPQASEITENSRKVWTDTGGELISLPPDEQAALLKLLASVGADVSKEKPLLSAAYKTVSEAADRTR